MLLHHTYYRYNVIYTFLKEKITKVIQLWQKNNIFSNDLIDKLTKLASLINKNLLTDENGENGKKNLLFERIK